MLTEKELMSINGGGIGKILIGIGMFITMIVGIADGFVRPLKCN